MKGKRFVPCKFQQGFTLPEMLIVMVIVAFMVLAAQGMTGTTLLQLKHFSGAKQHEEGAGLPAALQWLENDILQIRGDLPWYGKGSLEPEGCMTTWTFTSENKAQLTDAGTAIQTLRYRVEAGGLWRDIVDDNQQLSSTRLLLNGVRCVHLRFFQANNWLDNPLPDRRIRGVSVTIHSEGPTVERLWPVDLFYDAP
ncbi:prepilin-type N-terminal cleavage/methylation domain-containing protein [Enterobacter kobei]|uniref:prepilin-type N-terminal cleavage/methylation domain-containing protein n=1 Tax=Enterobacter kobei TaxID=208224 RepID=UPI003CF7ECE2